VVDVAWQSAENLVATVDTINGLVKITVDCRSGGITPRGEIPLTEEASFIRDVCSDLAASSSASPENTS
jgi:hypothetical protein